MFRRIALFQVQFPKWVISWVLVIFDLIAGLVAFEAVLAAEYDYHFYVILQIFWLVLFLMAGLYSGHFTISRIGEFQVLIQLTFTAVAIVIFLEAAGLTGSIISARKAIQYWFLFFMIAGVVRMGIRTYQKYLLRHGIGRERAAIIGYNSRGRSAANLLLGHEQQGFDVIGFIRASDDENNGDGVALPLLGHESDLVNLIMEHKISTVVVALKNPDHGRLMELTLMVNGYPVDIKVIPDLSEVVQGFVRTQQIAGLPLVSIHPVYDSFYMKYMKRPIDFIFASVFILLSAPLWLFIAAAIKLNSEGPVLYKQVRSGYKNRKFTIYKFRSMKINAEATTGPVWAGGRDPRVTAVGRFLRRFRLDEIPQLINVLRGEMSLIGPRPERPYFIKQLEEQFPFYRRRMNVYPGITGWSQIKHPPDEKIEDVREKLKYDFYYIENISWNLDLKIALSTIWVVLSGHGR